MDPLNLILLIMVVLIGWRLRSVLGARNDDEKPGTRANAYRLNRDAYENPPEGAALKAARQDEPQDGQQDEPQGGQQDEPQNMTTQAPAREAENAPQMGRGLAFLRDIDPQFNEADFLAGAARAYEMILTAFAAGDLSDVRAFLGDEVARGFDDAIAARTAAGQKLETRILRLDRPALEDAEVDGETVRLDVRFRAEIISAAYAADSVLDEENLPAPSTSIDVWCFEGAHSSANAGWKLVATRTG